jgi:GTPase
MTKLQGEFDDGRGYARSKIFIHQHEKESGRTSTITKETMKDENKVIEFIDLAGHEKYFRTTIRGICNNCVDYVLLLINGNMGTLTRMTLEHIYLVLALRIPLTILITKTDMAPENVMKETIENIKRLLKRNQFFSHILTEEKDLDQNIYQNYMKGEEGYNQKFVPIIKISNKTGDNIELLRKYLFRLERIYKFSQSMDNKKFIVNNTYSLTGIGLVLSGICYQGSIKKGDVLSFNRFNTLIKVQVKSLHDDFQNNIEELYLGESGCIAIKVIDKYFNSEIKKKSIRGGCILMEQPELKNSFMANIMISNCSVTIKENYQPVINSMSINQSAVLEKIIMEDEPETKKKLIRTREFAKVRFKFLHHPEYINPNQFFVFRDGRIKGIGRVVEV